MTNIEEEYAAIRGRPNNFKQYGDFLARAESTIKSNKKILILPDDKFGKILVKSEPSIAPNNDESEEFDETLHEGFIGLYGINKLKSSNFSQILDAYIFKKCIENEGDCSFVISTYIPGSTLLSTLEDIDFIDYKSIILQVILALFTANQELAFTHYDLHPLNIIVRKTEHTFSLPDGRKLKSGWLPVIIDYGSSHIKLNGVNYGRILPEGFIENKEFWVHDVFKILSFVYDTTKYVAIRATIEKQRDDEMTEGLDLELYDDLDEYITDLQKNLDSLGEDEDEDRLYNIEQIEIAKERKIEILDQFNQRIAKAQMKRQQKEQIAIVTEELLKFFNRKFDIKMHLEYREEYPFFQVERTSKNKAVSFVKFVNYALQILT